MNNVYQVTPENDRTRIPAPRRIKRKPRIFFWVFLAVQGVMLFLLSDIVTRSTDCSSEICEVFSDLGTNLALTELFAFWAVVNTSMGFAYIIHKLSGVKS